MTGPETLTIALNLADQNLAERVTALLGEVTGVNLVADEAAADLILSQANFGDDATAGRPADALPIIAITPRESEVVVLLAEGLSNKAIALRLGIAPDTAKFHVARLIEKLDASGRTEVVIQAARRGIVQL